MKTYKELMSEGWGADKQKRDIEKMVADKAAARKKYSNDKDLLKKAEKYWSRGYTAQAGIDKAMNEGVKASDFGTKGTYKADKNKQLRQYQLAQGRINKGKGNAKDFALVHGGTEAEWKKTLDKKRK